MAIYKTNVKKLELHICKQKLEDIKEEKIPLKIRKDKINNSSISIQKHIDKNLKISTYVVLGN